MSGPKAEAEASPDLAEDSEQDVEALLAAAREARTNKDMKKCLELYEAAAQLGSGDGHYAAALFYLGGQIVAQDFKKGTSHLRAAAEAGILSAKIYMANLYELGIHYAPDAEKADVWYRNAARAAEIEEGEDYARKMADIGSARHYLELASDESTTEDDRAAWGKKARALGYQLKTRSQPDVVPPSTSTLTSAPVIPVPEKKVEEAPAPVAKKPEPPKKKPATWFTPIAGIKAFAVEVLFMGAALATGFLATEGAKILIQQQGALPILGNHAERAYGIAIALIGILPALLVYRARTVAASIGAGAVTAAIGFWLHGSPKGTWLEPRPFQILVFALAGFLGCALALGMLDGAKPAKKGGARTT